MLDDPVIDSPYCTNCGTELIDKYCHTCGQKKIELKDRTVKAFIVHFFEEFLTFDSKFFRSMKYLFFKPGYLTHEYISGRFVRYVSPLKMYLFTSIVVFFILLKIDPDTYRSFMEPPDSDDFLQNMVIESRESKGMSEDKFSEKFNSEINNLFTPGLLVMMLIFSVCLKMIYINKRIYYVEHLVFTLHFFSMILIFITIGTVLKEININAEDILYFSAPCIYLLLAVKKTYHSKWKYALISSIILSVIYIFLLLLWAAGITVVTLVKI